MIGTPLLSGETAEDARRGVLVLRKKSDVDGHLLSFGATLIVVLSQLSTNPALVKPRFCFYKSQNTCFGGGGGEQWRGINIWYVQSTR